MSRLQFTERNVPKNLKVVVRHWHDGNSTTKERHGFLYATEAFIFKKGDDPRKVDPVAYGRTFCSHRDRPRRAVGRQVAVGRALKAYFNGLIPPF